MPTTYAHDLFGREVFRRMPEQIRQVIKEHGEIYRIGLHGPDILFYFMLSKNPVTRFGISMHQAISEAFFKRSMKRVRETGDRELLAYVLGFGCHYLLDSACHPFVEEAEKDGVISHARLEKEFDRTLMLTTNKNPLQYRPSDCILPKYHYARVIHRALPEIPAPFIWVSLKMMKLATNAMVCNNNDRRGWLFSRLAALHSKKSEKFIRDYFMTKTPCANSVLPVRKLTELFDCEVEQCEAGMEELYRLSQREGSLSERWRHTYNG